MNEPMSDDLASQARKVGVGSYRRHLFLCVGPNCCTPEQGLASWEYLKRRLNELGMVAPAGDVYRTKVGCFRICRGGPIGVVYPDGTWYCNLVPENIERVIQEHLVRGRPVAELVIGHNPLASSSDSR